MSNSPDFSSLFNLPYQNSLPNLNPSGAPMSSNSGLMSVLNPIGGIADILGGLFGSSTTTNTKGSSNTNYSQTPTYDPAAESLRQQLINSQIGNLNKDTDLSGYTSQGLQTINQGYDAANNALQQTLAARGLSYSPLAGASTAALGTQRIGAGINFQNQVPLLQQQLLQQKLASALQTFASMPYSVSGQQNQTSQSQSTQSGGGLLSGLF